MGHSYLHVPYRFLPRLFLCTPSFRRCGVTSTVCCGSGWISLLPLVSFSRLASSFSTGPQEWTRQLQWEYIQLSFAPYYCTLQSWLHADAGSFDFSVVTCKPSTCSPSLPLNMQFMFVSSLKAPSRVVTTVIWL